MLTKEQITTLVDILGRFKDLKRSGWLKRNIASPESDAEHSFSTCFLAFILTPENLNRCRCMELALIHDLAEIYCGDYTPCDNISPQEKHLKEEQGANRLAKELNNPELLELFNEFEAQKTPESRFVKALDKLDTTLSAFYYDKNQRSEKAVFKEFSTHAQKQIALIQSPDINEIKQILDNLMKERITND